MKIKHLERKRTFVTTARRRIKENLSCHLTLSIGPHHLAISKCSSSFSVPWLKQGHTTFRVAGFVFFSNGCFSATNWKNEPLWNLWQIPGVPTYPATTPVLLPLTLETPAQCLVKVWAQKELNRFRWFVEKQMEKNKDPQLVPWSLWWWGLLPPNLD